MFGVKIISVLQGSAKTNTAFLLSYSLCIFMYTYINKAFRKASEKPEVETVQFGIKSMHVHFDPMGQFINEVQEIRSF